MILLKNLAKKIICVAPPSVGLSGNYESLFNLFSPIDKMMQGWTLNQSDFFSENDWEKIQLTKLRKILIHAGKHVPYWRKLFRSIGFVPENLKKFKEFSNIPILTRGEIKKIPIEELSAQNIPAWRFKEAHTSGST